VQIAFVSGGKPPQQIAQSSPRARAVADHCWRGNNGQIGVVARLAPSGLNCVWASTNTRHLGVPRCFAGHRAAKFTIETVGQTPSCLVRRTWTRLDGEVTCRLFVARSPIKARARTRVNRIQRAGNELGRSRCCEWRPWHHGRRDARISSERGWRVIGDDVGRGAARRTGAGQRVIRWERRSVRARGHLS